MDQLTKLAIKYKTDKWGKHHYTPVYYEMYKNKSKRRAVKKVLEIGVAEGAGLRMFRDFFTNAVIYGAEIDPKRIIMEEGIQVSRCDQSNREDIARLISRVGVDLDLVIDDGSHKPEDQVFTCISILPAMKKGCTYVIEDVADDKVKESLQKFFDVEERKVGDRYDDRLIIVRQK